MTLPFRRSTATVKPAFADDALQTASAITGGIVIIFFLRLLMLIEVPSWRAKLVSPVGADEERWETVLVVTGLRFRQYSALSGPSARTSRNRLRSSLVGRP